MCVFCAKWAQKKEELIHLRHQSDCEWQAPFCGASHWYMSCRDGEDRHQATLLLYTSRMGKEGLECGRVGGKWIVLDYWDWDRGKGFCSVR